MKQVSQSEFTTDVNNGVTLESLTTKYGLSKGIIKGIAKDLGLKIKRSSKPLTYVLVNDTNTTVTETYSKDAVVESINA